MKKISVTIVLAVSIFLFLAISCSDRKSMKMAEESFNKNCALCHPGGGNTVNPAKPLHKKDLDANNIKTEEDIVKIMREPGPGMNKFDENTIPDKEAKEIAGYILNTFK
ncbi:MAG: cytochrome C [Nitrospiraceae bacterium]|nr:MAG: cytochrome C [Nitrospiraceae bacterium]